MRKCQTIWACSYFTCSSNAAEALFKTRIICSTVLGNTEAYIWCMQFGLQVLDCALEPNLQFRHQTTWCLSCHSLGMATQTGSLALSHSCAHSHSVSLSLSLPSTCLSGLPGSSITSGRSTRSHTFLRTKHIFLSFAPSVTGVPRDHSIVYPKRRVGC